MNLGFFSDHFEVAAQKQGSTYNPASTGTTTTSDSVESKSTHNSKWWLSYSMIASLGAAVGGSADTQLVLGRDPEVIPLLLDTLGWSTATSQVATMTRTLSQLSTRSWPE